MDISTLIALAGQWQGTNLLWLDPTQPPGKSHTEMQVTPVQQDTFVQFQYTWAFEGQPHEGILLVGYRPADGFFAAWTDTFHSANAIMQFIGRPSPQAAVVHGSYSVEGGPEWGWDIAIRAEGDGFALRMFNIMPDGARFPAVEAVYTRI